MASDSYPRTTMEGHFVVLWCDGESNAELQSPVTDDDRRSPEFCVTCLRLRVLTPNLAHRVILGISGIFGSIMSYADLRALKQAKGSRSYVSGASSSPTAQTSTVKNLPRESEDLNVAPSINKILPPSIDVRTSQISGRGIWTKDNQKAGATCSSKDRLVSR